MKNYNLLKLKEKIKIFFLDTINILYYIILYCISNWLEGVFFGTEKGCTYYLY